MYIRLRKPNRVVQITERVDSFGMSPKMHFAPEGGSTVTRVLESSWSEWSSVYADILGESMVGTRTANGRELGYIKRLVPWAIPLANANTHNRRWLWADDVQVEGIGVPTDIETDDEAVMYDGSAGGLPIASTTGNESDFYPRYEKARYTVRYSPPQTYTILSDDEMNQTQAASVYWESSLRRYVTKMYRPGGEFLTLEGQSFYYAGAPGDQAVAVGYRGVNKLLAYFNIAMTWHQIPVDAIPSKFFNPTAQNKAIDLCLGRVNSTEFFGCDKGTLLMTAVELKPYTNHIGEIMYDVTYAFKFFNPSRESWPPGLDVYPGHQHIYRAARSAFDSQGWYELVSNESLATANVPTNFIAQTNDTNIYDWSEFKYLFEPANYKLP